MQSDKSWSSQGLGPQVPPMHIAVPQLAPHFPQLAESVLRSVHLPEQLVVPDGQVHTPLMQAALPGQTVPQLPQLAGSTAALRQIPLQHTWP
jgi:hypothetical protein